MSAEQVAEATDGLVPGGLATHLWFESPNDP